jgi:spermidine/putrescine transport system substrate-binding protein
MSEEINCPEGMDPSFWRGLTQRRVSRRDVLRIAGLSAGSSMMMAGGGAAFASSLPNAKVGTKSWWAKQTLHHKLNFANWPLYIDTVGSRHPSLDQFTKATGVKVNYIEAIQDDASFYSKIRPSLAARQPTGYDLIVMTNNNPELGYLMELGWLVPLDHSKMSNFDKHAGPLVKSPAWDPGNKYSMAWQSGWTAVGYNSQVVKNPGDSIGILFSKKYKGQVGMLADPFELGCAGLLAIGIEPAKSTESDWAKAAKKLKQQKSDGIVVAYYDQSYISHLKNGDVNVCQAYSGDIFQANLTSKFKKLKLLLPHEGAMLWTDNMVIPLYAQNPRDAMAIMDFFYSPLTQAVVEYYDDYVCPVPSAKQQLLHPTGWAVQALKKMAPVVGLPTSVTANSPLVFPNAAATKVTRPYYNFKSQQEIDAWNGLFLPIVQGA